MIRVKIPSPYQYILEETRQALSIDVDTLLSRYMELVARDISFPCQPVFRYENLSIDEGFLYADIDPETLPDYFKIKSDYESIDSSLIELVTETLVSIKGEGQRDINHETTIAFVPKSEWDADTLNAYLWALIRTIRPNKAVTLSERSVMMMYTKELLDTKGMAPDQPVVITRGYAIDLAQNYIDIEGLHSILKKHSMRIHELEDEHKELDEIALYSKIMDTIRETSTALQALSGHAIAEALKGR